MATEEDNFDIDIYGDGGEDYQEEGQVHEAEQQAAQVQSHREEMAGQTSNATGHESAEVEHDDGHASQKVEASGGSSADHLNAPKQAPQAQGLKRKEGADDRTVDAGATTALFVSDLHWWITDDDIRGWANQSECEDELTEITFSEHKVNGKSKGQVYMLFQTPQAATATKRRIETFGEGKPYQQKFTVSFTSPFTNPFKTLPKDGNARSSNQSSRAPSGGYNSSGSSSGQTQSNFSNPSGGFRGGRGGYNNRGGGMNSGYRGGYQQPIPGSYQNPNMNSFQANQMNMPQYGGFQNRGGMMRGGQMGMRGRGGMVPNNMMGLNIGGMLPNQMSNMNMGMPQINAGMMQGGGFQNPGFFPQQGSESWNPHGAKRTRQE